MRIQFQMFSRSEIFSFSYWLSKINQNCVLKIFTQAFFEFVCIYKFLWQIFLSISQFHESVTIKFFESNSLWLRGYVARTPGFRPDDPGTNPSGTTKDSYRLLLANVGLQRLVKASKGSQMLVQAWKVVYRLFSGSFGHILVRLCLVRETVWNSLLFHQKRHIESQWSILPVLIRISFSFMLWSKQFIFDILYICFW